MSLSSRPRESKGEFIKATDQFFHPWQIDSGQVNSGSWTSHGQHWLQPSRRCPQELTEVCLPWAWALRLEVDSWLVSQLLSALLCSWQWRRPSLGAQTRDWLDWIPLLAHWTSSSLVPWFLLEPGQDSLDLWYVIFYWSLINHQLFIWDQIFGFVPVSWSKFLFVSLLIWSNQPTITIARLRIGSNSPKVQLLDKEEGHHLQGPRNGRRGQGHLWTWHSG